MDVPFKITRLTGELLESARINPVEPHRHDHEELIILSKGKPCHYVDFTRTTVESPVIIYVAQGKVHSFHPDIDTRGWVIRYNSDLLPQSRFNFYSNFSDKINFQISQEYCDNELDTLCTIMRKEYKSDKPNYDVIRHLMGAVLARLDSEFSFEFMASGNSAQHTTFISFLKILDNNYKRPEGVDFYADKLNMSSRNLNLICNTLIGKSITEIIDTRKLIEARRLLLNSSMSISEIGYDLGYNEKSYFTRVFRKKTGVTPSEFREKMKDIIS